ncbi:hypothetical protein [Bacillus cereus group sp. BfR-BA-01538]|uniref:hypothetical protein n=1 Tax=Bacillus cereus group sp. BfR-BA-01538 TaxID=2920373 RepID=UPI001F5962DA
MKTIEVYTTNDKFVVRTEDFEPALLNKELNNGEITTVLIDYLIISRLDVKRVVVLDEIVDNSVKKVKVSLRNGQSVEIPVEADFDIKFLNAQLNSSSVTTVLIGSNIYQKFEVVQVVLIKEEPKEPEVKPEEPKEPEQPPVTEPEQPTEGGNDNPTT